MCGWIERYLLDLVGGMCCEAVEASRGLSSDPVSPRPKYFVCMRSNTFKQYPKNTAYKSLKQRTIISSDFDLFLIFGRYTTTPGLLPVVECTTQPRVAFQSFRPATRPSYYLLPTVPLFQRQAGSTTLVDRRLISAGKIRLSPWRPKRPEVSLRGSSQ